MFSPSDRTRIRDALVARAESDPDIVGAALVGSAARDAEDEWSDIDLVLQLAPDANEPEIAEAWSQYIDDSYGVADTLDVFAGAVRYRVFLLESSLQIDVSFWPHDQFRATEPSFRLLFGEPGEPTIPATPHIAHIIGMGWLYALHARSAIARGKLWQAVMMLDDLRDQVIALKCVRYGLNPWHGRDADSLPLHERTALLASRAERVDREALAEAQGLLVVHLLEEIRQHDAVLADRLRAPFAALAESGAPTRVRRGSPSHA